MMAYNEWMTVYDQFVNRVFHNIVFFLETGEKDTIDSYTVMSTKLHNKLSTLLYAASISRR